MRSLKLSSLASIPVPKSGDIISPGLESVGVFNYNAIELAEHDGHLIAIEQLDQHGVQSGKKVHAGMETLEASNACDENPGELPQTEKNPHTIQVLDGVIYAYISGACASTIPYLVHMLYQAEASDKFVISVNNSWVPEDTSLALASAIDGSLAQVTVKIIGCTDAYEFIIGLGADELIVYDGIFNFRQLSDFGYGSLDDVYTSAEAARRYSVYLYSTIIAAKFLTAEEVASLSTKAKLLAFTGEEMRARSTPQ